MGARNVIAMATFSCITLMTGCVIGPDYERPEVEVPEQWRIDYRSASDLTNAKWWQQFNDPVLDGLIETALKENLDIRIAAGRVNQFLGQLNTTRAEFFPQLGAGGGVSRNRISEETFGSTPGSDPYYTQYEAALGASWQLDLFGRVQRQTESVQAQVYASEQGRRGVILSVVTGVTSSYVALRGLDRQLVIAQETELSYKDSVTLFKLRHSYGTVSQLEVDQVESQYQLALAAVPLIEAQIAAQENLISILLGRSPGAIGRGKSLDNMTIVGVPEALPASLLTRRPDIQQAEQNLISANAAVGVAESLYYPDISITGNFGQASADLGDLLDSSAKIWDIGASITAPIFTFGRIEGQIQSAEALRQQAEDRYRFTLLSALKEVNDALVSTDKNAQNYQALKQREKALLSYAKLADMRFENGAASYLEVLYANNELFQAQLDTVSSQIDYYSALIDVYKSMGGGWVDQAVDMVEPVAESSPDASLLMPEWR
ncbi:efflux transporter outer membrane subunit [Aestuariirhabdus haliotis]|uniref:efflux transporter outer membrane subunit n=1 Tax=Aestuariirhabdus haliotis TaxID=2918751 RepID=UPI0020C0C797|nr:efflux transporter outer membrane subunit [Aestuariirhabdus haliotis]MCL6421100.1 efflux transporter outer membrane subunit [Aestuariirhabdus haliotis]